MAQDLTVRQVIEWAKAKGYVSHNPLAEVDKPAANTRQEFVKFEDWGTLIGFAIGQPFKDYITVMLYTGARATEMLKFEALHFDKNRLVLTMKSSFRIPATNFIAAVNSANFRGAD